MSDTTKKTSNSIKSLSSKQTHVAYGYPVYNLDNINERWKCVYCSLLIKEPIQLTECDHRCCKGCYESRVVETGNELMVCPVQDCQMPFSQKDVSYISLT